jgi:hypothetical protein
MLAQPPLDLPPPAIAALSRAARTAAQLQARCELLEAVCAASPGEAAAAQPKVCAACRSGTDAGVKLQPCRGCADGPAGRTYYCSTACQKAAWPHHRAFCRAVAAARATAGC